MPSNTNKLRSELVTLLLADRAFALRENNPGAAVTASSRITDLMIGKLADDAAANATPVTQITHRILFQSICPHCKERGAVIETPPPPPEPEQQRLRRASAWDDIPPDEPEAEPQPQPRPAAVRQTTTIEVPKLQPTGNRRRDRIVSGLA